MSDIERAIHATQININALRLSIKCKEVGLKEKRFPYYLDKKWTEDMILLDKEDLEQKDIILDALRYYAAAKDPQPCEYCGINEKPLILMDDTVAYIHYTPEINEYQLVLGSYSRGGWTVGQQIHECPICGRKL